MTTVTVHHTLDPLFTIHQPPVSLLSSTLKTLANKIPIVFRTYMPSFLEPYPAAPAAFYQTLKFPLILSLSHRFPHPLSISSPCSASPHLLTSIALYPILRQNVASDCVAPRIIACSSFKHQDLVRHLAWFSPSLISTLFVVYCLRMTAVQCMYAGRWCGAGSRCSIWVHAVCARLC